MASAGESVLAKIAGKVKGAVHKHRATPVMVDQGVRLPGGIEHGIARLTDVKFDLYKEGNNAGKPYFRAAGVVLSPEKHDGTPIKGLQTSIIVSLFDTGTKTTEDNVAKVINHFKLLGVDTSSMGDITELEAYAEALKEQQPTFRFRTWKGKPTPQYPDPRVNEVWGEAVDWVDEEPAPSVEDNTGSDESEPEPEPTKKIVATPAKTNKTASKQPEPDSESTREKPDLDDLLAKANNNKKPKEATAAQEELKRLAIEAGNDESSVDDAENWEAVVELIKNDGGDLIEQSEPDNDPVVPEKGEIWKIENGLNKKKQMTYRDVEILSVNTKKGTASVKDLDTGDKEEVKLDELHVVT